jgi:hypothetical protein
MPKKAKKRGRHARKEHTTSSVPSGAPHQAAAPSTYLLLLTPEDPVGTPTGVLALHEATCSLVLQALAHLQEVGTLDLSLLPAQREIPLSHSQRTGSALLLTLLVRGGILLFLGRKTPAETQISVHIHTEWLPYGRYCRLH